MRADKIGEPGAGVPDETWIEIETAIGLKERSAELRRRVAHYVRLYYSKVPFSDPLNAFDEVRPKHWRTVLSELDNSATKLADYLDLEHSERVLNTPEVQAQTYVAFTVLPSDERKTLVATLRLITEKAKLSAAGLPTDKGGPLPDLILLSFIHGLATLYEDTTGRVPGVSLPPGESGPYGGPFFRFVEAVSRRLVPAERQRRNGALGKAIQRALVLRRKSTGAPKASRRSTMDRTARVSSR